MVLPTNPGPATTLHAANLRTTVAATRLSRCSAFGRSQNCRSSRRYAANVSVITLTSRTYYAGSVR